MRYTDDMSETCVNLMGAYHDAEINFCIARDAMNKAKEELDTAARALTVQLAREGHYDFLTINKNKKASL